jgi:4-amino-4-deoxy-L-arabinose transferase-like glycosyltransferase
MKTEKLLTETQTRVWWALGLLLLIRLVSLGLYPLMDNTEARYGEIARVMLASGDWVTPWYDNNIPFWGKPPLSFWTTAISLSVFGVNEFAARLPHLLTALGLGWLVWSWAAKQSRQEALAAIALLAACILTLISAGAVMTDMTLALGTTLAMRGFWLALHGQAAERTWERWLFFLGLTIGVLAKGPLALVLAGLPLGLWTLWNRQLGRVWRDLPWWRGSLMILLLAGPWYVMAELRTPGFLNYFLLGEHWHRYVTPGWSGDRYGGAHSAPWGSIWAYAWFAVLPWSLMLPVAWWRWHKSDTATSEALATPSAELDAQKPLHSYWILWSLAPAVFFTFAGNILWTYVLPALPPLALLGAAWLSRTPNMDRVNKLLTWGLALSAVLMTCFVISLNTKALQDFQTTKPLIARYEAINTRHSALFFYPARPYSAAFYSKGQARALPQPSDVIARMAWPHTFIAVKASEEATLPADVRTQLRFLVQHGDYKLFEMGNNLLPLDKTAQLNLAKP